MWRRAESTDELEEVGVLRQHDCRGGPRGIEDGSVRRAGESESTDVDCLDSELLRQMGTERGRELLVEPDEHSYAATTG